MILFSILLGLWAIVVMNFKVNIFPDLKYKSLVTKGPYENIRHPMYTAVLIYSLSFVLPNANLLNIALFIVLFINLYLKSEYEEQFLMKEFKEYEEYKARTKKFIPNLL